MNTDNDGGPAFPIGSTPEEWGNGMTLRDYFAAKAMQSMLAVPNDQRYGDRADKSLSIEEWQEWGLTGIVEYSYKVADAMLKARETK